jgi:hypothetical protein
LQRIRDRSIDDVEIRDVDLSRAELVSEQPKYLNMSVVEKRHRIQNLEQNVYTTYKLTSKQTPK